MEQTKESNESLIDQLQKEKDKNETTIAKLNRKIENYSAKIQQDKDNLKKQEYIIASFQKDNMLPNQWNIEVQLFN